MLNQQHLLVNNVLCKPDERQVYQVHMCGLCHALGGDYGLASRLITNHEMILLNMLVSSQSQEDIEIVERRCPLNPLKKVSTNQGIASKYAAAVAIQLTAIGAEDHVKDSKGQDIRAGMLSRFLKKPRNTALKTLMELGLDCEALTQLGEMQTVAEQEAGDPSTPSAIVSGELFAMTSDLANSPENKEQLAKIGVAYGEFLYLLDAFRDFTHDITYCEYNPLRRFSQQSSDILTLSRNGIKWLLSRFEYVRDTILTEISQITFYRNSNAVGELLLQPINLSITTFSELAENQKGLTFKQFNTSDVLRTVFFSQPIDSNNREQKLSSVSKRFLSLMGITGLLIVSFGSSGCDDSLTCCTGSESWCGTN